MALTNDQITAQNFKDFYGQIRPYLNGQVPTFANQFSRSDLYSTDEKIIGQWIDGKPLYQKTVFISNVSFPSAGQGDNTVLLSENNVNLVDSYGCLYRSTAVEVLPITSINSSDGCVYWTARIRQNKTDNVIALQIINYNLEARIYDLFATLRYTKTTDSAIKVGTGTDYSTEEQIIGTWIDGKPLYQKTVQLTMPTTTSQKNGAFFRGDTNLDVSAIGIAQLVELKAVHNSDVIINIGTYFGYTNDMEETQYGGMQVIMCWYNHSSNLIQLRRFSGKTVNSDAGATVYVTLQYTKTTD